MLNSPELIEEVLIGAPRVHQGRRARASWSRWSARACSRARARLEAPAQAGIARRCSPKRIAELRRQTMVDCAERACAGFRDDEVRDIHVDMMRLTLEIVGKTLARLRCRPRSRAHRAHRRRRDGVLREAAVTVAGLLPQWVPTPRALRVPRRGRASSTRIMCADHRALPRAGRARPITCSRGSRTRATRTARR